MSLFGDFGALLISPPSSPWPNVKLQLHGEGSDGSTTFTDSSPLALAPTTISGNVQIDTAQSKYGAASILFDGTGDVIRYADRIDWRLNGAFTLEAFVRFNAIAAGNTFLSRWGASGDQAWLWDFLNTNNMRFGYTTDGDTDQIVSRSWSPSTATWYHVAACRDGSGNLRLFADGNQLGATATSIPTFFNNANQLWIGALEGFGGAMNNGLNGWLDEVRVTAAALYTANFTPPAGPHPDS